MLPNTACALAREAHKPPRSATTSRALKLTDFLIEVPPTIGKPVECLTTELEYAENYYSLGKQFQFRTSIFGSALKPFGVPRLFRECEYSKQNLSEPLLLKNEFPLCT